MEKMITYDILTNDILNAIVRRTYLVLSQLQLDEIVFQNDVFCWCDNILTTVLNNVVVTLTWNGEMDDDKCEVQSSISRTATSNLSWFIGLENKIFTELEKLKLLIPPKEILISKDEHNYEDNQGLENVGC